MITRKRKGTIALISVHGDPDVKIGKEEAGGQNVYVRKVGEALAEAGWRVDMFTRKSDRKQPTIVEHQPNCRTIRLTAGPQEFVSRDLLFNYLPEFVKAFLEFQNQSKSLYHLIHTNYWLSSWVGMELRKHQLVKLIHTYHSLGAVKYKSVTTVPLIASTRLKVEKTCLETADCIVATSPQEREDMRSLVSPKGNIEIIPCGTDIKSFGSIERQVAREKLGIKPETKVIIYAGRFDARKGIETLVRSLAREEVSQFKDLQLYIVGGSRPGQSDGIERDRIEEIIKELGLQNKTKFTGRLEHDVLRTYYAAADVCVVPSHYEPFGLVAIEAMACGTPVVASDVGGLQFTVAHEETGLLAPPQDEVAFAKAIGQILADNDWRDRLGKAARSRVKSYFSWDGVATRLDTLYQSQLEILSNEFFAPRERVSNEFFAPRNVS